MWANWLHVSAVLFIWLGWGGMLPLLPIQPGGAHRKVGGLLERPMHCEAGAEDGAHAHQHLCQLND